MACSTGSPTSSARLLPWPPTALPSAPALAVSLQLDMTGAGVLSGVVTGPGGVLPLHTERAAYSAAKPAPQAGQYATSGGMVCLQEGH